MHDSLCSEGEQSSVVQMGSDLVLHKCMQMMRPTIYLVYFY